MPSFSFITQYRLFYSFVFMELNCIHSAASITSTRNIFLHIYIVLRSTSCLSTDFKWRTSTTVRVFIIYDFNFLRVSWIFLYVLENYWLCTARSLSISQGNRINFFSIFFLFSAVIPVSFSCVYFNFDDPFKDQRCCGHGVSHSDIISSYQ
jgi:hypothetical protein